MTAAQPPPSPRKSWWEWPNFLALDAVAVALVWMPLMARSAGARLRDGEYVVLACGIWCVYMLDRMLDGLTRSGMHRRRHEFAARWWRPLAFCVAAAAGVAAWHAANAIPEIVMFAGLNFCIALAVYFGVTLASRSKWPGLMGAGTLSGLLAVALMQGAALTPENSVLQIWRAIMSGFIITLLYMCLRQTGTPAPWTLPRKMLGGWLFAVGTSLAPFVHKEMWRELFLGSPVVLFGCVCAFNSLAIRLWERSEPDFEERVLQRMLPWMLTTVAAGAFMECAGPDTWSRPVFIASGVAALLLLGLHTRGSRIPLAARRALADLAVLLPGAVMLTLPR